MKIAIKDWTLGSGQQPQQAQDDKPWFWCFRITIRTGKLMFTEGWIHAPWTRVGQKSIFILITRVWDENKTDIFFNVKTKCHNFFSEKIIYHYFHYVLKSHLLKIK